MRAQDVLPDGVDQIQFNWISVRKGSVAAFLPNARVLADAEAVPALCATGLFDVLQPRDETVRAFVDALKSSQPRVILAASAIPKEGSRGPA
jgi:hypothetical protein